MLEPPYELQHFGDNNNLVPPPVHRPSLDFDNFWNDLGFIDIDFVLPAADCDDDGQLTWEDAYCGCDDGPPY